MGVHAKNRLTNALLLAVFLSVSIVNIYWLSEDDPLTVTADEEEVQSIYPGGTISFSRYVCSSKQVDIIIQRRFDRVDGGPVVVASNTVYTARPECKNMVFYIEVPDSLKYGDYIYRPTARYHVNPSLEIVKDLPPVVFSVN